MAIAGIPGTDNIGTIFSGIGSGLGQFVVLLLLFLATGGIFLWWHKRKNKKKKYNKKIFWFEEVNGNMIPIGDDLAAELPLPGTNFTVFYIKEKDMYLPRPTKKMGKDSYWFAIKKNRELVNFVMKNINEEMVEANLEYDHTDMRYALTNLKELIKRNYRDKSQPWWREYKEVISLVILIFVLTLSFIFIAHKVGTLIDKVGALIDHADQLINVIETKSSSGVVTR